MLAHPPGQTPIGGDHDHCICGEPGIVQLVEESADGGIGIGNLSLVLG